MAKRFLVGYGDKDLRAVHMVVYSIPGSVFYLQDRHGNHVLKEDETDGDAVVIPEQVDELVQEVERTMGRRFAPAPVAEPSLWRCFVKQ